MIVTLSCLEVETQHAAYDVRVRGTLRNMRTSLTHCNLIHGKVHHSPLPVDKHDGVLFPKSLCTECEVLHGHSRSLWNASQDRGKGLQVRRWLTSQLGDDCMLGYVSTPLHACIGVG